MAPVLPSSPEDPGAAYSYGPLLSPGRARTKEVTFDAKAVSHGEGDGSQVQEEGSMSHSGSKPALADPHGSDQHINRAAAARVHKVVSFKRRSSTQPGTANGSALAFLAGSGVSRDSQARTSADESTPAARGGEFAPSAQGSASGPSSIAFPRDVIPGNQQERSPTDTQSVCISSSPGSQLSRKLGSRFAVAFLAPFKELGGGELNFDWAYKEATTGVRERTLSGDGSTYKAPATGGSRRLSSRLSDAAMKVPAGLYYFPLRFKEKDAEKEYVAVTNYQLSLRLSIFLLLQHFFLLPLQFVLFFSDPLSRLGTLASDWFFKPLIHAFIGISVFGLLLALALLYPRIIPFNGGYLSRRFAGQLACVYSFVRLFSFNTEISLLYVYAFASNLLLLDLIGPILSKWTLHLHVVITAGFASPFIVGYADGHIYSLCTLWVHN
ncbi:hypothetical protein ACSSS7_005307 [Eimeria intestinalis]